MIEIPAVKICGVTSVGDAELALASGASYIGLIFAAGSPRKVALAAAFRIAAAVKGKARLVGVFRDNRPAEILDLFGRLDLDLVQYHGAETPGMLRALALPSIKAFEIDQTFNWDAVRRYEGSIEKILLDRPKTGSEPEWLDKAISAVRNMPGDLPPFFFAGGLDSSNVQAVIRRLIGMDGQNLPPRQLHALDVASGVESAPGVKDPDKLKSFCQAVSKEAVKCKAQENSGHSAVSTSPNR